MLGNSFTLKGEGFVTLAGLSLSVASIYGNEITRKLDPFLVSGYQLSIGGIILILLGYVFGGTLRGARKNVNL